MHLFVCVVNTVYGRSAIRLVKLVNPSSQINAQNHCPSEARSFFCGWRGLHARLGDNVYTWSVLMRIHTFSVDGSTVVELFICVMALECFLCKSHSSPQTMCTHQCSRKRSSILLPLYGVVNVYMPGYHGNTL